MNRFLIVITTFLIIMIILLITFPMLLVLQEQKPVQPTQPATGPGGADYQYTEVNVSTYGEGENQYWIFEPDSPKNTSLPVIIFMHGWGATTPMFYRSWINHLVKKGNIVIYPRYQLDISTPSDKFTKNSVIAIKEAILELESGKHVRPQLDKVAIVGHSVGGLLSVNLASVAASEGLPQLLAVFAVEPGKSRSSKDTVGPVLENLTNIPPSTLLLALAGDQDNWVGDQDARRIIRETIQIPQGNKDFVLMNTDVQGYPPITADHFFPLAATMYLNVDHITLCTNAPDYYGTWKLFDGLYNAAFYGKNMEYALGNTSQQRFMGYWSDGTPVKELNITVTP
jgi:acetyl esterase/lipase